MAIRQLSTKQIVNLPSDPISGVAGEIYYNTTTNSFKYYNGTTWSNFSSGGSGNSFETINTPNGTDPVADSSTDTLNITESNGIIITGNSTTDTIDISTNATSLNTASTIISRDSSQSFDITGIDFDTTDTISSAVGRVSWDNGDGTLSLGLKGGNVDLKIGQQENALCYNGTNATLTRGTVVYISGAQGQRPSITKSNANSESTSSKTFGVVSENITNGAEGYVTTFGIIRGLDTSSFTEGSALWLSTTDGLFTQTMPTQPNHSVFIGYCIRSHATSGEIFVKIQNGYELQELHNILITSVADNHILSYDSTTSLWKNQGLAAAIQEVDGAGSNIDADLLDGQHGSHYLDWTNTTNKPDPTITLGGDLSGSITLTDLTGGTLTATVEDDSHNHIISNVDGLQDALNAKAPLESPALTGTPTAPTANAATNTTQIATTAFVRTEISNLVDAAPSTLDTLNELAAALGDDPNYATTISTALGGKEPTITAGTTAQYWRGDKSWQTLDKSAVGLSNVENTALSTWSGSSNITTVGTLANLTVTNTITGSISGNAGTVTNGIYSNNTYSDPSWITALSWSKISSTPTTLSGYGITDAQPLDADLTSIAALTGTSGFLKTNGSGTWTVDNNTYLTTSSASSTYAPINSPTFTGTVTAAILDLTTAATATTATSYWVETGSDGIIRPKTLADTRTEIVTTAAVNAAAATTVGTVTSGTWNATTIAIARGGTGLTTTPTNGQLLVGNGTGYTLAAIAQGTGITVTNGAGSISIANAGVTSLSGTTNQISVSSSTGSSTISLPSSVVFPGTVTLNADPTQALQAATKQYVDAVAQGLHIHASAQTATTANITNLASPPATIDGITLTNGMRVLVKNQSTTSQNGVYVFNAGALTRASDFDTAPEIHGGDFIFVTGGTVNNDTGWVQTETVTTVGTDPILFQQFSGAGTYTAGNGLTLTGSQFSINTGVTADLSTAQTLTNKTINGANNTLTVRLANDITGFGTGVATALAVNVGSAGAFVTFNGALGTPSSATLTNATGLPVSSGISGLGTGIATFLATPTSANLISAITDETGTGSLVFATSPTLTTPNIGAASATSITIDSTAITDTVTTSVTTNTATTISSIASATYRSAEYLVQVVQGSKYTVSKLIMIHDGTTAHITEYSLIELGASRIPLTISGTLSSGNILLQATITDAASTNATVRVVKTAIVV